VKKAMRAMAEANGHVDTLADREFYRQLEKIAEDFKNPLQLLRPEQLPPVIAARTLIADTVGILELKAYRNGLPLKKPPAIIRQPDPTEPLWETLHRTVMHLTAGGNAWYRVTSWDAADRPQSLEVLNPDDVNPELDEFGQVQAIRWRDRKLGVAPFGDEVVHVPLITTDGPHSLGHSPLTMASGSIDSIAALYGYTASYWANGGQPSLLIKVPHRVSKAEADEIRSDFLTTHRGRSVPAVLWGGAEVQPWAGSAAELQLSESHDNAVAEIARLYRIPPSLLNAKSGDSLTYSTVAEQLRSWLMTGLSSYLVRIESAFTELTAYGTAGRFDTSELQRADFPSRIQAYTMALGQRQWLKVDEVREKEGFPSWDSVPDSAPDTVLDTGNDVLADPSAYNPGPGA
jgi:HK97 family phage portal protein